MSWQSPPGAWPNHPPAYQQRPEPAPTKEDIEHLRLLAIFHFVYGALKALISCIPLVYVALGAYFIAATPSVPKGAAGPAALFGGIFIAIGIAATLIGWTLAACVIYAGRCLQSYKHPTFCMVVAVLCSIFMPIGTALGVFTLVVLTKPGVKKLFGSR